MASTYGTSIFKEDLILNVDCASLRSFPRNGNKWKDLSRRKNNGTIENNASFNTRNRGTMRFDGSDEYIDFTSDSYPDSFPFTMSCWMRTDAQLNSRKTVYSLGRSDTNNRYIALGTLRYSSDGPYARAYMKNGSGSTMRLEGETTVVQDGKWHEIVYVGVNQAHKLYVDGKLEAEDNDNQSTNFQFNLQTIGCLARRSRTEFFDGDISIVRCYNRALTPEQIELNYVSLKGRFA